MSHVVIAGTGRSGSNRMLDIFDVHEWTNCRNEPNVVDTPMRALLITREAELPADASARWDALVEEAKTHKSAFDRMTHENKGFATPATSALFWLMSKTRAREMVWGKRQDWAIPGFGLKHPERIIPVLKVISQVEAVAALHESQPDQAVIHVTRDPRNYLNSWWNRLVLTPDFGPEVTYQKVRELRAPILEARGEEPLAEEFSMASLLRGELVQWRQIHEHLADRLGASPRYGLFPYEDTDAHPVEEAARAYALAGLDFTAEHEARVRGMKNTLFAKGHSEKLDEALVEDALQAVLGNSPIGQRYLG